MNTIDRTIPYKNIIMRCDDCTESFLPPKHIFIRGYHSGDERNWAKIEYEIGDFESVAAAECYFTAHYLCDGIQAAARCFFAERNDGAVVGTCTAWYDKRKEAVVSSLHWLAVTPENQNQGIGKALVSTVMDFYRNNNLFPVYLHTQPWSYHAVRLYHRFGFHIMKKDTFADYHNESEEAIEILKYYLPEEILK